jgi:hypothetical protein
MRMFTHAIVRLVHKLSRPRVKDSGVQARINELEEEVTTEDLQHPRNTSIFFLLPPI